MPCPPPPTHTTRQNCYTPAYTAWPSPYVNAINMPVKMVTHQLTYDLSNPSINRPSRIILLLPEIPRLFPLSGSQFTGDAYKALRRKLTLLYMKQTGSGPTAITAKLVYHFSNYRHSMVLPTTFSGEKSL